MPPMLPTFSLVVSTLGRGNHLPRLLASLEQQTLRDLEVIIVDQNDDAHMAEILAARPWPFAVEHVRTPRQRGLSRGRNAGWRRSRGRFVVFPDDDCWYPPWLLSKVGDRFEATSRDIVAGRAADETGRSINGRYEPTLQPISRANVWTTSIEWMTFFRREVLEVIGGYDEAIGVGAGTPWQAAEGQEILLRALSAGFTGLFDPAIYGFHAELDIRTPDAAMLAKARAYGRGMGYVLGRHGYGLTSIAYWLARPLGGSLIYSLRGQRARGRYYWNVAKGRWEGWRRAPTRTLSHAVGLQPERSSLRLAVGIATSGRRELLSETLAELGKQVRLPDRVVVCSPSPSDVDAQMAASLPFPVTAISTTPGLPAQRNAILREVDDTDAIVFFDDDFFPAATYLSHAELILGRYPTVVLATGKLIEDGIHGPGLSPAYARQKLADAPAADPHAALLPYYGVYGCNMVVRLAPVRKHGASFDEALPLYAWQEDIDFSRQLAPFGDIVQTQALTGVHLGVKLGRTAGVRFGYSQIANPIYLMGKGTMSVPFGARTMARNVLANLAHLPWAEPHVDRHGRCEGNLLAVLDLLRGRLHPQRILEMN
ncbi:MAG TPA: glycosyltransferase [Hyphomicrobiaceae bacterium]|nr:glycosyltransferase [Hyphomicrobiaceae bacterium]